MFSATKNGHIDIFLPYDIGGLTFSAMNNEFINVFCRWAYSSLVIVLSFIY